MPSGQPYFIGTAPTIVTLLERIIDPFIAVITLTILLFTYKIPLEGAYLSLAIIAFLLSFLIFRDAELVRPGKGERILAQSSNLLVSWIMVVIILILLGYATGTYPLYSKRVLAMWFGITPVLILIIHVLARLLMTSLIKSEENVSTVVIAGVSELSKRLTRCINDDIHLGMSFKGYFEDRALDRVGKMGNEKILGSLNELPEYIKNHNIDVIYIALPMTYEKRVLKLLDDLHDTTASIYYMPDIFVFDLIQARMSEVHGIPLVALCETPFQGINGVVKRLSDIVFASLILILISPLMIMMALLVKLTSRGPIIFKQRRYGLDGKEILVYKFRTMTVSEDGADVNQAKRADPRVTRLGACLRRCSLDELPQFINVLQGSMSVVGPRPHAVVHNETYRKLIKGYMVRHKVRPGITGWAQVNGLRGQTDTIEKMKTRVEYDLDYLRHWSLGLDTKIIIKTALMLFRDRNAF